MITKSLITKKLPVNLPKKSKHPKLLMIDPIYCNNYFTHNVTSEDNEDLNRVDKSASDLCDNISNLLDKYIQTEEDDNDLFLKMIGKKMKSLPLTVKNRLQERFLKEVNDEIRKLNVKI